jgi:hypothetical protein
LPASSSWTLSILKAIAFFEWIMDN